MSKKQLLERIEKLEELVSVMQAEINLLSMCKHDPCLLYQPPVLIPQPVPYWQPTFTNPYIVTVYENRRIK